MKLLLERLADLVGVFQARAPALDEAAAFPAENIADLARIGALMAPLPVASGGMGAGSEPAGATLASHMLRLIGRGHLPTGRLFEGHVNAIKLIAVYAPEQMRQVAEQAAAGQLAGLWVTEAPPGLRIRDGTLQGGKIFCSGAGHLSHALVTAQPPDGEPVLARVTLDGNQRAMAGSMRLQGMRSATTGSVDLSGLPAEIVGAPGDYLRQPEFSAGAWRTSAVACGGIEALVTHARDELHARGRAANPHQLARVGAMLIAQQTALMWVQRASRLAEQEPAGMDAERLGDIAAGVNLARIAVEQAGLDVLRLVQRSLGLSAFRHGHPAEALMRDLATYLRQPAPDETLTEAAAWHMQREMPA